ncbi:restriction endonuclease subunit S [Staphylococcus equorum]|uniref:restriction endonuclease subunit S n=1 Tax=Staphylococcus equorum TaxID=246432 RepID=UPI000E69609D|nr:restriction endonuclease subunit S [Staphylococcus equorum]RIL32608.1 restriction endonuclease subunit S [Staphylococcus equorum]
MTNEKNVPELRFSGFKDEWRILKLGDSAIIKGRLGWKGLKQEEYVNNGHAFLVANKHINNGKVNWKKADQINQFRYEESLEIALQKGDLIFSKDGALGNPAIINELPKYATINSTMMLVRPYKEKLNSLFFYQILLSSYFNKLIHLKVSGSSIPHLFQADMKDFDFFTPKLEEQKKIGDFFSKLDRQIELEEQKLEKLEEQKKGYMQKIFSQEIRFKDDNGNDYPEWESKNFLDIFKLAPSKNNQIKSSEVVENGIIPVVDQGKDIFLGYSNEKDKAIEDFDNVIVYGDHTTIIKYIKEPFIIGGDGVKLLESNDGSLIHYLYILLQYFNVKPEGYKRHYSILKNKMMNISNTKEEQEKIGNFFTKFDELIEKQNRKIDGLKKRKKGFLQKMFI